MEGHAEMLSTRFISHADRVRFVNDLDKAQHVAFMHQVYEQKPFIVESTYYAVSHDESAFVLMLCATGGRQPVICRITIDRDGKVDRLWSRRSLLANELHLLKHPEAARAREAMYPALRIMELPRDAALQQNMIAALTAFLDALHTVSDADRLARVQEFTTRDFQAWEGTAVWRAVSDTSPVLGRQGLCESMGFLSHMGGASIARHTRTMVRAMTASASHNVAFLHIDFLAATVDRPMAFDVLFVFTFDGSGHRMRQAVSFRSASSLAEYASVFKTADDIEPVAMA